MRRYRLQPALCDDGSDARRREELNEALSVIEILRSDWDGGGEYSNPLHLGRKRSYVVYTFNRQKLADLLEPDLCLAAGNDCADSFSFDPLTFGPDLLSD